MSSTINKGNEKDNTYSDDLIDNQINITKCQKMKKNKEQNIKGLGIFDPNNNLFKKCTKAIATDKQIIKENNPNAIFSLDYNPLTHKSNYLLNQSLNNNILGNTELLNNMNLKSDEIIPNPDINKMMLTSKSDKEIILSNKNCEKNNIGKNGKNENILFLTPNFLGNNVTSESEHNKIVENLKKKENGLAPLDINIHKMFKKRESYNLFLKYVESSYKYNKIL